MWLGMRSKCKEIDLQPFLLLIDYLPPSHHPSPQATRLCAENFPSPTPSPPSSTYPPLPQYTPHIPMDRPKTPLVGDVSSDGYQRFLALVAERKCGEALESLEKCRDRNVSNWALCQKELADFNKCFIKRQGQ